MKFLNFASDPFPFPPAMDPDPYQHGMDPDTYQHGMDPYHYIYLKVEHWVSSRVLKKQGSRTFSFHYIDKLTIEPGF